jgi:hypothetical protein
MKGGKGGRPRRGAGAGAQGKGPGARAKPKRSPGERPSNAAPAKGSRKKPHFGGRSSTGDEV